MVQNQAVKDLGLVIRVIPLTGSLIIATAIAIIMIAGYDIVDYVG